VENFNVSDRHGPRPHLFQILPTQTWEIPNWAASSREDQCVTPKRSGGGSNVADTTATSSTCAGRPGFGRSARPPGLVLRRAFPGPPMTSSYETTPAGQVIGEHLIRMATAPALTAPPRP
jgi:hypothetical protein